LHAPQIKEHLAVAKSEEPERFKELTLICILAVVGVALTGAVIWFGWDVFGGAIP
jgi:hypothetical protein